MKRRKEMQNSQIASPCESPAYLPTEVSHSPDDDWSNWTSFNIELEVHPTPEESTRYYNLDSMYSNLLSSFFLVSRRKKISNLCESLLGFVPGVTQSVDWHGEVSLRQRVMVEKLIPGGPLHQGYAHVQQGIV